MNFSPGFKQFVSSVFDILVKPFAFFTMVFAVVTVAFIGIVFFFGDSEILRSTIIYLMSWTLYGFGGALLYRWFGKDKSVTEITTILVVLMLFGPVFDLLISERTYLEGIYWWSGIIAKYVSGAFVYEYFAPKVGLLPIQDRNQDEE